MTGGTLALLALLVVGGSAAAWLRLAHRVALPRDRRGFVAVWLAGVGLALAALALGVGAPGAVASALALLVAGFLLLTVAVSGQRVGEEAIGVGDPLPDVSAPDENGEPVALARFRGRPVLIKFFRGHW